MVKTRLKIYYYFILFAICLFSSCHTWADEYPGISHAKSGFSMRPKVHAWSPVTVYLTNDSDQDKELELVIPGHSPKTGAEKVFCRRPVHLPPQSKRQERFYCLISNLNNFEVELYQKGYRIARDTFPTKGIESNKVVFLIIDNISGSYSFLSKLKLPNSDEGPVPVYSHPKDLPEKWIGYDGIDVVILGNFRQSDFNGSQLDALKKWLRSGGRLIISSGKEPAQYQNSFVEELLKIKFLGLRIVTNLPAMVQYFKHELKIDKDLDITEVEPLGSKVILKEGQVPLILSSSYGLGEVFFLAFDATHESLTNWQGVDALWKILAEVKPRLFSEDRTSLPDKIGPILTEVVGISVPKFNQVFISLTGYIILIILGHLIFRFYKRPELAWLIYLIVVPITIWLFYQFGQVGKGGYKFSINEISLTELSPDVTSGRSLGYLGIFSPDGITTSLGFHDQTAFGPRTSRALPDKPLFTVLDVEEEEVFTLKDINLAAGRLHLLSFNNILTLGEGINVRMKLSRQGLSGEIINQTGLSIDDCILIYNRHVKPVGLIPNGQTLKVQMHDPVHASPRPLFSNKTIKSKQDVIKEKIISSLFTPPLLAKPVQPGLMFLGWLSSPAFRIDGIEKTEKQDALALVFMRLPIEISAPDEVFIPKGICDIDIPGKGSGGLFFRGEWLRSQHEGELIADFKLPLICSQMHAKNIKIYFQFESAYIDVKLDVYNWLEGRWVRLPIENQIILSDALPYLADGKVRLKVKGEPVHKKAQEGIQVGFWEIKDLDIEVRGILND